MSHSVQTRVIALAGVGVLGAAALFIFATGSAVALFESGFAQDHQRFAAAIGATVERELADDLRIVSSAAGADPDAQYAALSAVLQFGRLSSAAFVAAADGTLTQCVPENECHTLPGAVSGSIAKALQTQRPVVGDLLQPAGRVIGVVPFRSQTPGSAGAGVVVNAADRRLVRLLDPLRQHGRAVIVDASGALITGDQAALDASVQVPIRGTTWTLRMAPAADAQDPAVVLRRRAVWLGASLTGLAALVMLFAWGMGRSVRQPLAGLTRAAEQIAGGDLARPIDPKVAERGGGEISRLAIALERMRASLLESMGEIETANRELEERVERRTRDLAAANARRQQLVRKLISAQEDERKRIARELHDEMSQTLAALGMAADVAFAKSPTQAPLVEVRRLASRMSDELHRLIMNLRPSVLDDLGLAAAIRWFAERELAKRDIAVRCEIDEPDQPIDSEVETALFRAVQEAIVNIGRHSQADTVLIQVAAEGGAITVEIEDDGVGFDPASVEANPQSLRGIGLLGMRERLEIIGGELRIDSSPGSGPRQGVGVARGAGPASRGG